MSGKNKSNYKGVFDSLKIILGTFHVEEALIDFEMAMWHGLRYAFPEINFKGCALHWVQVVNRKLREIGLSSAYNNDEGTRAYCRRLFALPFAPHELIPALFQSLKAEATEPLLVSLCGYIESTWITVFRPSAWSMFQQNVRTNNDVEGWNNRLNRNAGQAQIQMYLLIELHHKEAEYVGIQTRLVQANDLRRMERKEYRDTNLRIKKLWDLFSSGKITAKHLLASCGRIYAPSARPDETDEGSVGE